MAKTYKVSKIANPRKKNSLLAALGAGANPHKKEKHHMAKAKKAKGGHKKPKHNPFMFAAKSKKKPNGRKHHPRSKNPIDIKLGGQTLPLKTLLKLLFGGLAGVAGTKFLTPLVPIDTSTTAAKAGISALVAFAGGKAVESIDPEIGYGYHFGAYMHVLSLALNGYLPNVGSRLALQGVGRRPGVGAIMNARMPVPFNPFSEAPQVGPAAVDATQSRINKVYAA